MNRSVIVKQPRYRLPNNVFETALDRIRWVFDEFEHVAVSNSGGKDSTVVVELALIVAREKGRLPLTVQWLDQECEFEATVRYQRELFARPEIHSRWYQVPFRLFNATSHEDSWANVWGEGEEWVREKEPDSIHSKDFPEDRFTDVLHKAGDMDAPGGVVLTGVRAEESPARRLGLTSYVTYKWATWGSKSDNHTILHPIYDWSYRDIWRAIHENGWAYNEMYDHMYRYGIPPRNMRVSNYHHESAISSLFWLQEVEPETWEAATRRLRGISTAGQIGKEDYFVKDLPFMFRDWREYRDHLLANLVTKDDDRAAFTKQFEAIDRTLWYVDREKRDRAMVQALVANDVYFTKLNQFYVTNHLTKADLIRAGLTDEAGNRIDQKGAVHV